MKLQVVANPRFHNPKVEIFRRLSAPTAFSKRRQEKPGFNQDLVEIIKSAIEQGIRHIDKAQAYGKEEEIGIAIKESGIQREELFITTKFRDIKELPGSIDLSLESLQLVYVDL